jgi:polar amino acid transport system substrate-binding protein
VEYVIFDRQIQAVAALDNGEIDAVLGALESDAANYSSLRFSSEIYSGSVCLVTEKSKSSLILDNTSMYRAKTAYEMGTASYSQVSQIRANPIIIMSTQESLFRALQQGDVDMIVAIRDCVQSYLDPGQLSEKYTVALNYLSTPAYSILLRRNDNLRINSINGCINQLRASAKYKDILDRWIVNMDLENAQMHIRRLTNILGAVYAAALLIVVSIIVFNRQLRRMVDEKTSELKEKVDDLENAYTLRNKLVEHGSAANLVVRLDGTVLLMNDIARRMEGIPIEQPELPNIETMRIIGPAWERSPAEMDQPELLVLRDEDGNRRTYRYQCHRTSVQDERVFIVEDVTSEEQEKQDIFEESKNKALNRIIAGVAHEIKNPLTTIKTYASLAKEQGTDPEFMESFNEYIPREVDRISKMIETLMNYSRPPRGQKERFCMADVVDDCLGLAYISAKKKIAIRTQLDRSLYIRTSKEPIRQALVNLLMNSVESVEMKINSGADPEEQTVKVSVYRQSGDIVAEVYDTGLGMTEEQVQQCMDPFYTTKKTGTGMGLAMSKMYIRENGGRLEVESTPGEFTVMKMIFREDRENDEAEDLDR